MTRKLVESTFVTLDGVIGDPQNWCSPYWDDQHNDYAGALLASAEALVLGRSTYEVFAESWPARAGDPYSDRINAMPKYVASRTLTDAAWNTAVLEGDASAAIAALKAEDGGDLLKFGTGELDLALLEAGLVDEYRFWLFPVLAGGGTRLIDGIATTHLALIDTTRFDSGLVVNTYVPT